MDILWINVAYISRLIKRFTLQTVRKIPEAIPMLRLVIPVTSVDHLLVESKAVSVTKDLSAAAGTYVAFFTVPDGKRWTFISWNRVGTTAVTNEKLKISGTEYDVGPSSASSRIWVDAYRVRLNEGDSFGMKTTGDGGDNARHMQIFYEEEDSF